jgi:hypothetical protein
MKQFFFDLAGELSAHDVLGHRCRSRKEAKDHAKFIAHRIGTERPTFAKPGNYISVRDESGNEIFEAPIKSTVQVHGDRRELPASSIATVRAPPSGPSSRGDREAK